MVTTVTFCSGLCVPVLCMSNHAHSYPYSTVCILQRQVRLWFVAELHGNIPPLNTCVSRCLTGLLSPTHDSSLACYQIKTLCPFLYFEKTSLCTCMSPVTIFKYPSQSSNNIFAFIWCQCYLTRLICCCHNPKLWAASAADMVLSLVDCVGGLSCNLVTQGSHAKSKESHRVSLTDRKKRKKMDSRPNPLLWCPLWETEIRLELLSYVVFWITCDRNHWLQLLYGFPVACLPLRHMWMFGV